MKLKVSNLAHINSAYLNDDSDLTVIVGDNGTGKTLLLETYTLLSEEISSFRDSVINKIMTNYIGNFKVTLNEESLELLKDIFLMQESIVEEMFEEDLPRKFIREVVEEKIRTTFPDSIDGIQVKADIEIVDIENINKYIEIYSNEVKKKFISLAESKILFNSSKIGDIDFIDRIPTLKEFNSRSVIVDIRPTLWVINKRYIMPLIQQNGKTFSVEQLEKRISARVLNTFMNSIMDDEFIDTSNADVLLIPTERNSIIANSNFRTRMELENSNNGAFSRYSEFSFTMEFLKFKEELGQHEFNFFEDLSHSDETLSPNSNNISDLFFEGLQSQNETSEIPSNVFVEDSEKKLASKEMIRKKHSEKLTEMLGGSLVYNKFGELNSIIDADGNVVSSKLFSTKQNHISSFAILEENVRDYDVIIIEEPEANLSLKAIKQLVDYLFDLIRNYKVKMILTTHNELFFQRLNNNLLKNPQITSSVYEFVSENDLNNLKKLEKNDYGYSVELFNSELDQIFKETVKLQNNTQEDDADEFS